MISQPRLATLSASHFTYRSGYKTMPSGSGFFITALSPFGAMSSTPLRLPAVQSPEGITLIFVSHSIGTAPVVFTGVPGVFLFSTRRMRFSLCAASATISPENEEPTITTSYMAVSQIQSDHAIYVFQDLKHRLWRQWSITESAMH